MRNNYFRHLFAALLLLCTTMAAGAQTHTLTYRVDGQVYQTYSLAAGEAISHPAAPSKANHTFLGWSTSTNLNEIDIASNANDMLYSNAPCKTDAFGDQFVGWHVLFDGRSDTFFHSDYSGADSEDGLDHYLRVDMGEGKQVSIFTFAYTNRSGNSHINAPKTMVVEGSNEPFGEYETIATLTNLPSENSAEYESGLLGNGNAYRYVRFRVTATQQNQMKGGHPFFFMSEINMYEVEPAPAVMPDSDLTLYARYKSYSCDIEQDGIFYRFFDVEARTVKVTSCQSSLDGYSGTLDIPATVTHNGEEYTVVGVEDGALGIGNITSVSIPATFGTVAEKMFLGNASLESVTLADGITAIGANAFQSCTSLVTIDLPESITTIGAKAFNSCTALESIEIPSGVSQLQHRTFQDCSSLVNVVLPETITDLGEATFENCSSLTNINIPDAVTYLNYALFRICSSLTSIDIPVGVTSIQSLAFFGCYDLVDVTLPNTLATIQSEAFEKCTSLARIVIPNSVTTISGEGDGAPFNACRNLKTVVNLSSLSLEVGSSDYGKVAFYADKVVNAPGGVVVGDYVFATVDGVNTLVGYVGNATDIVLPENFNGQNYVIGATAFAGNADIVALTIPAAVTRINGGAFIGCAGLTTLRIEDGEDTLVLGCNITSEDESVDGEGLFYNIPLETLYIGRNLEYPTGKANGWSPFNRIVTLTDVTFGNTVTTIGDNLFGSCRGLRNATIPSSVTRIDNGAFANNQNSLESVFISDLAAWCRIDFGTADSNPLYQRANLYLNGELVTALVIPAGITEVKNFAFTGCQSITTLVVPEGVTTVGCEAFCHCYNLADIQLPETLTTLRFGAFSRTGIETISFPAAVTELPDWIVDNCQNLTEVELPATLTYIGQYAFAGCNNLTSIEIPSSVTSIRENAFENCSALKTVINFSNLTFTAGSEDNGHVAYYADKVVNAPNGSMVGDYLFATIDGVNTLVGYLGNATEIVLPENFNGQSYAIGSNAFAGNEDIVALTIPAAVTRINGGAFIGCAGLTTLRIEDGEDTLVLGCNITSEDESVDGEGLFYNIPLETLYIGRNLEYPTGKANGRSPFDRIVTLTDVTFGNTVTTIGYNLFGSCSGIRNVAIPSSVTSIRDCAFFECISLESVAMPENVTEFGDRVFCYCSSLREITIPTGVTTLGYATFYGCTSLENIVIPAGVEVIVHHAFSGCSSLKNVTIPEGVTSIGDAAFQNCTSLESVTVPSTASLAWGVFHGCTSLSALSFAEGMESIGGSEVFHGCSALESITIPASVTLIGDKVFKNCTSLSDITSLATTPPAVVNGTFTNIAENATLYVPRDCGSAYAATEWSQIPNIVELAFNLVYKVNGTVYATERIDYGAAVTPIDDPEVPGYTFVEWEGLPEYMPRHDVEVNAVLEMSAIAITISKYGSATYSSQYALDFSEVEGLKAYAATGYNTESGEITMTRVKSTNAGDGIYLSGEPNTTYYVPFIDHSDNHSLNLLVGTLKKTMVNTYSDDGNYVNYRYGVATGETTPKFFRYSDGSTCSAGKAYLQIPTAWFAGMASETVGIRFEEGELTDIDEVTDASVDETIVYDLNGRRISDVDNLEKGIYIINGKKVLVK